MTPVPSRSRALHSAVLLGTASFMAITISGAYAQGNAPVMTAQEAPEQVLITGSLIQGAAAVGVPVNDLREADFVETGKLSITEILKSVPALRIDAEASPTFGGGTLSFIQNVQIHGLGTGSGVETLLLVNGLRFPPQNYSNDSVNPSIIPQIALGSALGAARRLVTQNAQLCDQCVQGLLLADDDLVEFVDQIFGKTGLDFERFQALLNVAVWGHGLDWNRWRQAVA